MWEIGSRIQRHMKKGSPKPTLTIISWMEPMPQRARPKRGQRANETGLLVRWCDPVIHVVLEPDVGAHVPRLKYFLDILGLLVRDHVDVAYAVPFGLAGGRIVPIETEAAEDAGTLSHQPDGIVF